MRILFSSWLIVRSLLSRVDSASCISACCICSARVAISEKIGIITLDDTGSHEEVKNERKNLCYFINFRNRVLRLCFSSSERVLKNALSYVSTASIDSWTFFFPISVRDILYALLSSVAGVLCIYHFFMSDCIITEVVITSIPVFSESAFCVGASSKVTNHAVVVSMTNWGCVRLCFLRTFLIPPSHVA